MFKTMTGVLNPKANPSKEEINKIPSFIFCKWLSGDPRTILAANAINANYDIPIENQYMMVKSGFAGKIKFIPYPKQEKSLTDKRVDYLSEHFNISIQEAKECLELISKDELDMICEMYDESKINEN